MDIVKAFKGLWSEWEKSVTSGHVHATPFVPHMGVFTDYSAAPAVTGVNGETIYNESGYPDIPVSETTPEEGNAKPVIDWKAKPSQYFENVAKDDKVVKALVIKPNHEKLIGEGPHIPVEFAEDIAAINTLKTPHYKDYVDSPDLSPAEMHI